MKRLNTPNFIATNHKAQFIANIPLNDDKKSRLTFDRVLCDVPCSGDGIIIIYVP